MKAKKVTRWPSSKLVQDFLRSQQVHDISTIPSLTRKKLFCFLGSASLISLKSLPLVGPGYIQPTFIYLPRWWWMICVFIQWLVFDCYFGDDFQKKNTLHEWQFFPDVSLSLQNLGSLKQHHPWSVFPISFPMRLLPIDMEQAGHHF